MKTTSVALFLFAVVVLAPGQVVCDVLKTDPLFPAPLDAQERAEGAGEAKTPEEYKKRTELKLTKWDKKITDIKNESLNVPEVNKNFKLSVAAAMDQLSLQARNELDKMATAPNWRRHRDLVEEKLKRIQHEMDKVHPGTQLGE